MLNEWTIPDRNDGLLHDTYDQIKTTNPFRLSLSRNVCVWVTRQSNQNWWPNFNINFISAVKHYRTIAISPTTAINLAPKHFSSFSIIHKFILRRLSAILVMDVCARLIFSFNFLLEWCEIDARNSKRAQTHSHHHLYIVVLYHTDKAYGCHLCGIF